MRIIACLLMAFLLHISMNAQQILNFTKRFVESEDRWVAFQANEDSTHSYGFIYIDAQAGLTLNYEGKFRITETGKFIPKKLDSTGLKIRLTPNDVLVAFIPENKFGELEINAVPDWLKIYKTDTNSVAHLYRWGYLYNEWDQCAKALTYLERANQADPDYKGLATELAFSYNCLGRFSDAIPVLQHALKKNPQDAYTNKELIYALLKSGEVDKAAEICKKSIETLTNKQHHAENSYNVLYEYYTRKDKVNFNIWLPEARKWNSNNDRLLNSIAAMEKSLSQ